MSWCSRTSSIRIPHAGPEVQTYSPAVGTLKTMLRKHAATFGSQWDEYISRALWAYRNAPHDSMGEKPSYLLMGVDCRTPTEAVLLPQRELEATEVSDYREKVVLSLSTARQLASSSIRTAQAKYKAMYDRSSQEATYKLGDWVLVRFPQEETGRMCKLSRPWHGPYRDQRAPDVTVVKVYAPQDGQIQVHQNRVAPCPPELPCGFFWYGTRHSGPGRPLKWVDKLLCGDLFADPDNATSGDSSTDPDRPEHEPTPAEVHVGFDSPVADDLSQLTTPEEPPDGELEESRGISPVLSGVAGDRPPPSSVLSTHRRGLWPKVSPPFRLMAVHSGTSCLKGGRDVSLPVITSYV